MHPSGRLVHTIAKNESDYYPITQISEASTIGFSEGNYTDYKTQLLATSPALAALKITFKYNNNVDITPKTQLVSNKFATGDLVVGGREDLWDIVAEVITDITNAGNGLGAEVAQLHVQFPAAADEPARQHCGFHKVIIQPGKSEKVSFQLRRRDLSVWNVEKQEWHIVRGKYKFNIGASSRDPRVSGTLTM